MDKVTSCFENLLCQPSGNVDVTTTNQQQHHLVCHDLVLLVRSWTLHDLQSCLFAESFPKRGLQCFCNIPTRVTSFLFRHSGHLNTKISKIDATEAYETR